MTTRFSRGMPGGAPIYSEGDVWGVPANRRARPGPPPGSPEAALLELGSGRIRGGLSGHGLPVPKAQPDKPPPLTGSVPPPEPYPDSFLGGPQGGAVGMPPGQTMLGVVPQDAGDLERDKRLANTAAGKQTLPEAVFNAVLGSVTGVVEEAEVLSKEEIANAVEQNDTKTIQETLGSFSPGTGTVTLADGHEIKIGSTYFAELREDAANGNISVEQLANLDEILLILADQVRFLDNAAYYEFVLAIRNDIVKIQEEAEIGDFDLKSASAVYKIFRGAGMAQGVDEVMSLENWMSLSPDQREILVTQALNIYAQRESFEEDRKAAALEYELILERDKRLAKEARTVAALKAKEARTVAALKAEEDRKAAALKYERELERDKRQADTAAKVEADRIATLTAMTKSLASVNNMQDLEGITVASEAIAQLVLQRIWAQKDLDNLIDAMTIYGRELGVRDPAAFARLPAFAQELILQRHEQKRWGEARLPFASMYPEVFGKFVTTRVGKGGTPAFHNLLGRLDRETFLTMLEGAEQQQAGQRYGRSLQSMFFPGREVADLSSLPPDLVKLALQQGQPRGAMRGGRTTMRLPGTVVDTYGGERALY
jgi:hypothetical protein